jgi:hypothetical protein
MLNVFEGIDKIRDAAAVQRKKEQRSRPCAVE